MAPSVYMGVLYANDLAANLSSGKYLASTDLPSKVRAPKPRFACTTSKKQNASAKQTVVDSG